MSFLGIDNIHHVRGALARLREHFDTADSKDLGEAHGPSRGGVAGAVGGEEGLLGLGHVLDAVNTCVDQLEVLLLELEVLSLELEILFLEVLLL